MKPSTAEFKAFIHGMLNGHAGTLAGAKTEELCEMLTEIERELGIPFAVRDPHPCFIAITQTAAWKRRAWKRLHRVRQ